jgi:serine protease AprX
MCSRKQAASWLAPALVLVALGIFATPVAAKPGSRQNRGKPAHAQKLDPALHAKSGRLFGTSRVIVRIAPGRHADVSHEVRRLGGRPGRTLNLIDGMAIELPNGALRALAERWDVSSLHFDRPTTRQLNRAATAAGARAARYQFGYDGGGVGVAVIDSGITSFHDDLTYNGSNSSVRVVAGQRMTAFVDFVNGSATPYDDNGHGTHVAGIIAGNGFDSYGVRAGIAPGSHIITLKVLDSAGQGVISDVISAFEWAVLNRTAQNIRVINLSVGARITESYMTDPLTLAAKRAVDAGIVVVAAAGNLGRNAGGRTQYGGITAPGNAPWVLTVGASSTEGTVWRQDDVVAGYSSRGPTAIDYEAKPDLVAPGTGIVSLSDPLSEFYGTKSAFLLNGSRATAYKPYLSLSGTSMAAPVVAGTAALMLQANPALTPNLVKAILQYTAQTYDYDALTQGAGFLNAYGAVQLSRYFARAQPGDPYPMSPQWSGEIHWGNLSISGGVLKPNGNAWALNIVWGTVNDTENIVWGTGCSDSCENIVWGTMDELENIVWGTFDDVENIVWGTQDLENIVWGTQDVENIVWGTQDVENIVWGTMDVENIVWGTTCGGDDCENIVWGTAMDLENIVWGTTMDAENIVWGTGGILGGLTADAEGATWGSSGDEVHLFDESNADPVSLDDISLDVLFSPPPSGTQSAVTGIVGGSL